MEKEELSKLRHYLGKTQNQMSWLLGCSLKALQSFEQGRRLIPMHIERQALFILHMTKPPDERYKPCWVIEECPMETREHCPVWEFKAGHICWFINGTICHGRTQINWEKKMEICRQCKVFQEMMPDYHVSQTAVVSVDSDPQKSREVLVYPVENAQLQQQTVAVGQQQKTGNKRKAARFQQVVTPEKGRPSFGFDYCQAFKTIDTDQDGKITRTEVEAAANKINQLENIKSILIKFDELDKNRNAKLTPHEMNRAARELGIDEKDIKELMEFDSDHDGKLSIGELKHAEEDLTAIQKISDKFDDIDEDGDGVVTLNDVNEAHSILNPGQPIANPLPQEPFPPVTNPAEPEPSRLS